MNYRILKNANGKYKVQIEGILFSWYDLKGSFGPELYETKEEAQKGYDRHIEDIEKWRRGKDWEVV